MSRAWKPGDVAMWSVDDCADEIVFRYVDYKNDNEHAWATVDSGDGYPREGELRPLVVIDPNNREQVEMLRDLWDGAHTEQQGHAPSQSAKGARGNALQAALREFADPKPPKPAEPTGLGAVVEDADGAIWVRTPAKVGYSSDRPDWWYSDNGASTPHWDYIQAVRVLSEGVTA